MKTPAMVNLPVEWPKVLPCALHPNQVAYCLYMPISVPGSGIIFPFDRPDLDFVMPMLKEIQALEDERFHGEYVYMTVKRMIVGPTITPNRPGWHADGFGSDDLNFVWYDGVPTLLSSSLFRVNDDHMVSLEQFDKQAEAKPEFIYSVPPGHIVRLTSGIVHRVQLADKDQMRTFVKITVSKNQFNLEGNSTNPKIPPWPMFPRALVRNDPAKAQLDYHTPVDDHVERP